MRTETPKKRWWLMSLKRKLKTRQLPQRELNDDFVVEDKASQQASSDSLRSLIKRAITDVEQIVTSIKMKAQTEAEDEAVRIINQAKQGADEIRRKAEITEEEAKQKAQPFLLRARDEIEKEVRGEYQQAHSRLLDSLQGLISEGQNIPTELKDKRERPWENNNLKLKESETTLLSASGEAAPPLETPAPMEIGIEPDITSKEAQKQAEKEAKLAAKEEAKRKTGEIKKAKETQKQTEKEAKLAAKESDLEERVKEPVQLEKEVTVSEPAEAITEELPEQHLPEERPSKEEPVSAPLKLDSKALYTGEVELAIAVPVDPVAVSKLYNHLQKTPELKILYTRGSWDRGTTITVTLDEPLPLIDIISKIPGIKVAPELPQKDNLVKETSSSLLGAKRPGVKRIDLTLKEG